MRMTRRSWLMGAAAFTAAGLGASAAVAGSGKAELTRSVLDRLAGPINLPDPELAKLIAAVDRHPGYPQGYKLHLVSALERAGWAEAMLDQAGADIREDFELLERAILTELVVGTDYLRVTDRDRTPLTHQGFQPCSSPFARLATS